MNRSIALVMILCMAMGAAKAASLNEMIGEAVRTGKPQTALAAGQLGSLAASRLGGEQMVEVSLVERLAGECARLSLRLWMHGSDQRQEEIAVVQFSLCADGTAPQIAQQP